MRIVIRQVIAFFSTCQLVTSHLDVVYAAVQSSGQAAAPEMVQCLPGQDKEENHQGTGHHDSREKAQDVLVPGVEGLQDCLQEVNWPHWEALYV